MVDEKQVQRTARLARQLDPELSQRLIAFGFDPVAPIHEGADWFTPSSIKRALKDWPPIILKFGATEFGMMPKIDYDAASWMVFVLVEQVTTRYDQEPVEYEGQLIHPVPQLYIRGRLADTKTYCPPDAPRVHVYIDPKTLPEDENPNSIAMVQVVNEPSPPESEPNVLLTVVNEVPAWSQPSGG